MYIAANPCQVMLMEFPAPSFPSNKDKDRVPENRDEDKLNNTVHIRISG